MKIADTLKKYLPDGYDIPKCSEIWVNGIGITQYLMGLGEGSRLPFHLANVNAIGQSHCCGMRELVGLSATSPALAAKSAYPFGCDKDLLKAFLKHVINDTGNIPLVGWWPYYTAAAHKTWSSYGSKDYPHGWYYDVAAELGEVVATTRNPSHGYSFIRTVFYKPAIAKEYLEDLDTSHGHLFAQWQLEQMRKKAA